MVAWYTLFAYTVDRVRVYLENLDKSVHKSYSDAVCRLENLSVGRRGVHIAQCHMLSLCPPIATRRM